MVSVKSLLKKIVKSDSKERNNASKSTTKSRSGRKLEEQRPKIKLREKNKPDVNNEENPKEAIEVKETHDEHELKQDEIPFDASGEEDNFDEFEDEEDVGENDEEEEEEEADFVGAYAFDENKELEEMQRKEFLCLAPDEIITEQQKQIDSIADLLAIPQTVAATLLRHFQWKKERLLAAYFENPEKTRKDAGLSSSEPSLRSSVGQSSSVKPSMDPDEEIMCSICGDDVKIADCTRNSCGHLFCNECWKNYLTMRVNEGQVTRIPCPQHKCTRIVDESALKQLLDPEVYSKFVRFITKSFVEDSDGRIKWCIRPGCGNAITADMISGTVVKCSCGYRFCFQCHREAHAPCTCEQMKMWEQKCADDSETTHWKYANTKDCPKCSAPVEKNGGCNHMTCRQCKHEWCWVCMRAWKGHNDYYNCNKFVKTEKPRSMIFKKGSKKERLREKELERERNKIALERYLHYYERFMNHSHSSELEKQIRSKAEAKINELQQEATTASQVQYIIQGTEELLECRNALKYTYVFAYYLEEGSPQKVLFEYLQEDLEKTTEQLSEILETTNISQDYRLKALNVIQLAKTRKMNLLNAVEQGLTEEKV